MAKAALSIPKKVGQKAGSSTAAIYPVSPAQNTCLMPDADPDCTDDTRGRWVLAQATLVQPRVDMRRLQRALNGLVGRHDSLRTRFDRVKGRFRAIVEPTRTVRIQEVEIEALEDEAFLQRIREIANAPLPVLGPALAELIVVHSAQRGDVVVWRVHHAITDGFGIVILFEDMMKLLLGLPLTTGALSYADYVTRYLTVTPTRKAEISAFWEDMHRDLPTAPNIGRKAKGLEPLWLNLGEAVGKRRRVSVSSNSLEQLLKRTSRANLNPTALLFSGFLESLTELYDIDRLVFTTLIGRSDPGLDCFAGAHYFDPILLYRAAGGKGLEHAAQQLRSDLMMASEHLPSEAATQTSDYERALVAKGIYPRQFSVHQPRASGRIKKSAFSGGLNATPGVPQRMGPYTLTPLDTSVYRRCRTDLRFLLREGQTNHGFDLEYDGLSYDDDEVSTMSVRIAELLNLEITRDALA